MQFCTFIHEDTRRLGLLQSEHVIDLDGSQPNAVFRSMETLIAAGDDGLAVVHALLNKTAQLRRVPLQDLILAAPLQPSTVLCAGSNYRAHNAEKANAPLSGKEPEFFLKTSDCVIGPNDGIIYDPILTQKLDCETELAIVIGRPGRHISVENALSHVFGYTVANDVTARDRQVRRTPDGTVFYELGRGKAFDSSLPLGPVITSRSAIPDPQRLELRTRINGELRQSANTADMIWTCAELIHNFSINFTLKPGMVILTGTPAGTAWSVDAELGGQWQATEGLVAATRYCLPGDIIESDIEQIGILRNPVISL
jgi:2-keto-4-pentenoate hydratase/2-oxohepta-3-ene-1,7-dioic acid hydratase in catechol pathway